MDFEVLQKCPHVFSLIASIGGDTQAYAYKCCKCSKKVVKCCGINGIPAFDYVLQHGFRYQTEDNVKQWAIYEDGEVVSEIYNDEEAAEYDMMDRYKDDPYINHEYYVDTYPPEEE